MGVHRIAMAGAVLQAGATLCAEGDEAHHALRVRRLDIGDAVEILDGVGGVALARIEHRENLGKRDGWSLGLRVDRVDRVEAIMPRIEVYSEPPKGQELERMIDQLSQLGVARWSPMACDRSEVVSRDGKLDRLARIAREASKQCGRAWFLEIGPRASFDEALRGDPGTRVIVCHMSGGIYQESRRREDGRARTIRLLVGPIGDLSEREIGRARESGAVVATFGPLVMRIETACCAASAVVMASWHA